jgi:ABC-type oligopeptide transport system ATPase subunit
MSLLAAQALTVTARIGGAAVPVIRNLDFALAPGKILGLVGESGAGKSMVGRAIAQLLPPGFAVTGGRLAFAGEDLVTMPAERRRALLGRDIAFVPQEPLAALNPVLTVAQWPMHPPRSASPSAYVRRKCVAWVAANAAPAPISLVPSDLWDNEQAICAVPMHPASATLRGADSKVDYPANHRPLGRAQGGEPTPRKAQQRSGSSVPPGDKLAALRRTFRNCRAMSDGRRS